MAKRKVSLSSRPELYKAIPEYHSFQIIDSILEDPVSNCVKSIKFRMGISSVVLSFNDTWVFHVLIHDNGSST